MNWLNNQSETKTKINSQIKLCPQKKHKGFKWFSQMDRIIIKITCVIDYIWIGTWVAKPSHNLKAKQGILRKKNQ